MYQVKGRVRFSETGEDGRMTLTALLNAMQDCTNFQSDELGVGADFLRQKHRAWMLKFWQVFITRRPAEHEAYTVETRPWDFNGFFGQRNFALMDASGHPLAQANSVWFFVDTRRGRPVRPDREDTLPYGTDEPLPLDYAGSRKLTLPAGLTAQDAFPVRRCHLDVNHHVNNSQYVRMANEYFPENKEVAELRVEYRMAATREDTILPMTGENGEWYKVALCRPQGKPFAVVAARWREDHK